MSTEANQLLFMKWLATRHPALYNTYVSKAEVQAELSGFFDNLSSVIGKVGDVTNQILTQAPNVISQYFTTKNQAQLVKLNLERARRGDPPLNPDGSVVNEQSVRRDLPTTPAGVPAPVSPFAAIPTWGWLLGAGLLGLILLRR